MSNLIESEDSLVLKPVSARVPDVLMHSSEGKQVVNYRVSHPHKLLLGTDLIALTCWERLP